MHEMQFGVGRRRGEICRRLQHPRAIFGKIDFDQDQEFVAVAAHKRAHRCLLTTVAAFFDKGCANVAAGCPSPIQFLQSGRSI
jgi:hypothetical protein